jgi:hypothetical protein
MLSVGNRKSAIFFGAPLNYRISSKLWNRFPLAQRVYYRGFLEAKPCLENV